MEGEFAAYGWTVSGELCAKRLDGSAKSSAAIAATINVLRILLMWLVNMVASSCCKVKLRAVLILNVNSVSSANSLTPVR